MSYDNAHSNKPRSNEAIDFEVQYDKSSGTLSVINSRDMWVTGIQMGFDMISNNMMSCDIES
jgi:hypothetical protein